MKLAALDRQSASSPLVQMRAVGKYFPGVCALDKVDFELLRGEVHVLLGENGAGKSTLMRILSGAEPLDEGEILIEGTPVKIQNPQQAQRLGIRAIYQEFNLVPHLTVADNVFLGREPALGMGMLNNKSVCAQTAQLLQQLGIALDPRARILSLGVAQQQMVEVAKALAFDSKILIMDEPTAALTSTEIRTLFGLIHKLRQNGVGIVYISHRLEEIFEIGDRVTILRDGRRIATKNVAEARVHELIQLMADRQLQEHFPRRAVPPGAPMLEVSHLGTPRKLRDITFTLHAGEILGVAGLLGSGRSTLARALFGVDPISAGSVSVRREPRRPDCPAKAIRYGLGYLPEDRKHLGLAPNLSVCQNINLANPKQVYRWGIRSSRRERAVANRFVLQLRIKTPHLDQPVVYLSGGNQQKVVLSKWLACRADILIFDEPTRGIDVGAKVDLYELMNHLTEQGVGILMISSDLPEVLGMSDRILVMHQGRVAAVFNRAEASPAKVLRAALGEAP